MIKTKIIIIITTKQNKKEIKNKIPSPICRCNPSIKHAHMHLKQLAPPKDPNKKDSGEPSPSSRMQCGARKEVLRNGPQYCEKMKNWSINGHCVNALMPLNANSV